MIFNSLIYLFFLHSRYCLLCFSREDKMDLVAGCKYWLLSFVHTNITVITDWDCFCQLFSGQMAGKNTGGKEQQVNDPDYFS